MFWKAKRKRPGACELLPSLVHEEETKLWGAQLGQSLVSLVNLSAGQTLLEEDSGERKPQLDKNPKEKHLQSRGGGGRPRSHRTRLHTEQRCGQNQWERGALSSLNSRIDCEESCVTHDTHFRAQPQLKSATGVKPHSTRNEGNPDIAVLLRPSISSATQQKSCLENEVLRVLCSSKNLKPMI